MNQQGIETEKSALQSLDVYVVYGSRRWARFVLEACVRTVPKEGQISLVTGKVDRFPPEWLGRSRLGREVIFSETAPKLEKNQTGVAFVVNSAPLHAVTAMNLLAAGYHVVVEKPLSFSLEETLSLIRLAEQQSREIFSANIILFNSHIEGLRARCVQLRKSGIMKIEWLDPAQEFRFGEAKSFDTATPIIFDVLPHIATIVWSLVGSSGPPSGFTIAVERGGSEAWIGFNYGGVQVEAHVARNSPHRRRTVVAPCCSGDVLLDFSSGPGFISSPEGMLDGASLGWGADPSPISRMTSSVFSSLRTGQRDPRLNTDVAVLANRIIDAVLPSYLEQQGLTLKGLGGDGNPVNSDYVDYAKREMRALNHRVTPFLPRESPLAKWVATLERWQSF